MGLEPAPPDSTSHGLAVLQSSRGRLKVSEPRVKFQKQFPEVEDLGPQVSNKTSWSSYKVVPIQPAAI